MFAAVATPGCMRNEPLAAGRMDNLHRLSENRWLDAETPAFAFGDMVVPSRAVLTYEPSLLASAVDLASARDRLFEGGPEFRVLFAGNLSDLLAATLRDMADITRGWAEASEEYPRPDGRQRWAADTAAVLALLYRIERGSSAADSREAARGEQSMAASLGPVIRSLIVLLMKRMELETGEGNLLASLGEQRSLPAKFLLHGAFRLAELRMPDRAPAEVQEVFDHGPPTSVGVENVLRRRLLELRREAEDDRRPPSNKRMRTYLKAVPVLLRNMARVIEQWDKFYLAAAEVGRTDAGEMVSLVADVQPGQVVRMDEMHRMAPLVTLEGRTRINIWRAEGTDGDEVHVQFVNERGGRVALRFESWVYGLARPFTFPIEDWGLDEAVVTTTRPERHRTETTVVLLMTAREYKPDEDRRRAMRIHAVRELEVTTQGDRVDRLVRRDVRFEYYRPDRVWYYDRTWRDALPRP